LLFAYLPSGVIMDQFIWKVWVDLNKGKHRDDGFTLIELLVSVVIMGVLVAIALPSFLKQANNAKEVEARQYINYLNKHQTINYLETTNFTDSFGELSLDLGEPQDGTEEYLASEGFVLKETANYLYGIKSSFVYNDRPVTIQIARSRIDSLKSYAGVVYFQDNKLKTLVCRDYDSSLLGFFVPSPNMDAVLSLPSHKCQ